MKRAFDALVAAAALAVLSPVLALLAVAVWLEDFHNPFYAGRRIGRNGVEFRMVKFRSMRVDAWRSGVNSTAEGDARITRIGGLMRRCKLDELPQLWNVLAGQMSLVGPRPQVASEVALYTLAECKMLTVRPGITDFASIVFGDESRILAGSPDPDLDYRRIIRPWKSRLALLYVERSGLALDLKIIAWTALALVSRRRALDRVSRSIARLGADRTLARMALRREPLIACAPPGAAEIAQRVSA